MSARVPAVRFDLKSYWRDPSLLTNLLAGLLIALGYLAPFGGETLRTMGWFALSGAATNWLAIYMLFERVPGLYGSGIITLKFEEFKSGIHRMIMHQFFTPEHLTRFFSSQGARSFESHIFEEAIDFDLLFEKLLAAVQNSSFGPMLAMFGGTATLRSSLRDPFEAKLREGLAELVQSERFQTLLLKVMAKDFSSDDWTANIDRVVKARLDDLTPEMVKIIIQDMIRSHLGWLVVWGGLFGALMGLGAALLKTNL